MRTNAALALGFAVLSAAAPAVAQSPASAPARTPARTVDPVGIYDVTFFSHGAPGRGVITISGAAGNLTGQLEAHGHAIPLTVAVQGRNVILRDSTDLSITMTFGPGGEVTGKWSGHEEGGSFTVARRSQ